MWVVKWFVSSQNGTGLIAHFDVVNNCPKDQVDSGISISHSPFKRPKNLKQSMCKTCFIDRILYSDFVTDLYDHGDEDEYEWFPIFNAMKTGTNEITFISSEDNTCGYINDLNAAGKYLLLLLENHIKECRRRMILI